MEDKKVEWNMWLCEKYSCIHFPLINFKSKRELKYNDRISSKDKNAMCN